jgi:drug/metabolite transporter (DMT)-like permease
VKKKSLIADATLLFVVFVWGSTFVLVQDAISFLEPFSFNAVRFCMAFLFLLFWYLFFYKKKTAFPSYRKLLFSGFKMGIWLFLGYAFQTVGLLTTTPAKAGFITGLSVVLVPLFSLLLLKQKPSRNAVIGVGLATVGLYFMTMVKNASLTQGDFFVFLCAISFAMHIITTSKHAKHYPALELTLTQIATVALLSFASSFIFENANEMYSLDVFLQKEVLSALLITSLLATAFAFLAQTYFQAYTSPTRVALIFAMEPVFAAITSFMLISEKFTGNMVAGCIFIFLGMILAEWPSKNSHSATQNLDTNQTV